MRCFFACPLPEAALNELMLTQEQLKSRRDTINWVKRENLHLTLRFLGEVEECRVSELDSLLENLTERQRAFSFELGSAGIFGPGEKPRVLWVGLKGRMQPLREFVSQLEKGLHGLGFDAAEHAFRPHLTLGRVKSCLPDLAARHMAHSPLPVECRLDSVLLLESRLKKTGPEYNVLTRHTLCE